MCRAICILFWLEISDFSKRQPCYDYSFYSFGAGTHIPVSVTSASIPPGRGIQYMLSMMCKFIMVMEGESQRMKNGVGEFINFAEIGGHMLHRCRGMNAPASGSNDDFSTRSGDA